MAKAAAIVATWLCLLAGCREAWAYRPFDGTNAAVAEPGELELELGPAGLLREGAQHVLIAPAVVLDLGFTPGWEMVLQGQAQRALAPGPPHTGIAGNGIFLKHVLREGSLQDRPGISVATEFGALLPGVDAEPGLGGSVGGIVSERFPWMTVHIDAVVELTRRQHAGLFLGAIVEGPSDWTVRPAIEIFHEREIGTVKTTSALIGLIWQLRDNLALDAGLRAARQNDHTANEIRAGLTFGFPLW